MTNTHLEKDRRTLEAIGRIYCKAHHGGQKDSANLCGSCREAIETTLQHVAACPNGHNGNCQDCEIRCHRGETRERIREIMRYSAPRMALRHPVMTARYLYKKIAHTPPTP